MRNDDPLAQQLRSWGFAKVNRHWRTQDAVHDPGSHPISRARQFAPMTREKAALILAGRAKERRELMAARTSTGKLKLHILPEWAVDPIVCTESRVAGPNPENVVLAVAAVDQGVPVNLRWIDRAVAQLARVSLIRAVCLEIEFCEVGTQERKARVAAERYGGKLSVWQYRRELRLALDWLRMKQVA